MKSKVKSQLEKLFTMKNLGEAKNCVGLHITRNREKGEICNDQLMHTREFLKRFGMSDCNLISIPFHCNVKLSKPSSNSKPDVKIPYREATGCLLY